MNEAETEQGLGCGTPIATLLAGLSSIPTSVPTRRESGETCVNHAEDIARRAVLNRPHPYNEKRKHALRLFTRGSMHLGKVRQLAQTAVSPSRSRRGLANELERDEAAPIDSARGPRITPPRIRL